jgi:hypothetical protein
MKKTGSYAAMALAIGLFAGLPAHAQEETEARAKFTKMMDEIIDYVQDSCEADAKEFCSKVTPGEGRLLMCALAHEDKISDDCGQAIFDAVATLGDTINFLQLAVDDCEPDIEKTCADVEPGEGRIAQCLIDNKAKISASCQEAVAEFESAN